MINQGVMEVGTEAHPYRSKLTITMHGDRKDAPVPIFGKKSIGVHTGVLDIHGVPKKSWTELDDTVLSGESKITLVEEVDWEAGDEIMITSTSYDMNEAEFATVLDNRVIGGKSEIILESPLKNRHYAGSEQYGDSDVLTMRAEVCLMSRNVVYQGDPETTPTSQHGAHIMLHSIEENAAIGRIENLQLKNVGQASQMGKYPIHFHLVGRATNSYVKNNAIMHSFNRGMTFHGVNYLRLENNCYYDVMGHTIFIEDAAETKNYIAYNVVAVTKPAFSLLGTDTTPGNFWVTHPDNIFVGNRAAGSHSYGFWMDY
jgi:hypothetical protein